MRAMILMALLSTGGCVASTDALIDEAMESDDWSAVNKRFEALDRRERSRSAPCPRRTVLVCTNGSDRSACSCSDMTRNQQLLRHRQF